MDSCSWGRLLPIGHVYTDSKLLALIEESWRDILLNQISGLLPTLQQDPTPVTDLINLLISPPEYNFKRVLTIEPPVDFTAGFSSSLPPVNLAALSLLKKATFKKGDIDLVAGKADVVATLIKLWLCTPDTAVATRAHEVIKGLLLAGKAGNDMGDGGITSDSGTTSDSEPWEKDLGVMDKGLMWRRVFRDRNIYGSIFSICSLSTIGQEGSRSKREKTISQARLLEMLLGINSNPIRTSQIPDIEQHFGVQDGGLLQFAAIHMIDYQDDVLMHMTLINFYARFLGRGHDFSKFALDFLRSNGLHTRSMAYYLEPERQDSLHRPLLYGSSANYLAAYCLSYPRDLLSSPVAGHILSRVTHEIENTHSSQWAQGNGLKHDLLLLEALPRVTLLPNTQASSPLFLIPVKPPSPEAFTALSHILHCRMGHRREETAAARALYYLEMEKVPDFWQCVVAAADTVALKESALSALMLIKDIIMTKWTPLPDTAPSRSSLFRLPTEKELCSMCDAESLPQSGIEAIMAQPALGVVIPYLLRPAPSTSILVGRGSGDVESAAYKIAVAKYDVLTVLHQKLEEWVAGRGEGQEMVRAVGRRVAEGPMGGANGYGSQVGTLEL